MISKIKITLAFSILLIPLINKSQSLEYPVAHPQNIIDTFYNVPVKDEYRWLENLNSEKTKSWINEQNDLTGKTLKKAALKYNSYVAIDKYSYVKYDNPIKHRNYYFTYAYYNNMGVPALFYQKALLDNPDILIDPSFISTKDNIMLKGYAVSKDSKFLAYQFSRNGSDWGEIKVVNINTGIHKNDYLKNIKFSNIAWKDNGFYYSWYPEQGIDATLGQEVYYHKLNTEQNEDQLIFKRSNNPDATFSFFTTYDEKIFILKERNEKRGIINIFYIVYDSQILSLRPLITRLGLDENVNIIGNYGDILIAKSFKNVNNGMLVKINPLNPRQWDVLIPESESALLLNVMLLENKIITLYQENQKQQIKFFDYQGNLLHIIKIPFGFAVHGFNGEKTDKKILFSYSGYTQPKIVYILDTETFEIKPLRATVVNFDFSQFETKEIEYESFDSIKVPLFLIYKKSTDLTKPNPVLLKAYGGFGIISTPAFDPGIVHFLKEGGIFAFANIRGGGDKGKEWAIEGRGVNKQNSFKDFIAAAEFLINNNYTTPQKLAITGASNGGLVVGVAMTQRPDLFKVAIPIVAPFDMIRFENFTIGHFHTDEYGSVKDSVGFYNLLAYSPLHNIKEDVNYPATLIMTSDNDDRVPPLHSYKFAAKLQNREAQKNPILLRVEKKAGHYGATSSFKKQLKEEADIYNFILYNLNKTNY